LQHQPDSGSSSQAKTSEAVVGYIQTSNMTGQQQITVHGKLTIGHNPAQMNHFQKFFFYVTILVRISSSFHS
jgi:hypothetical protein